MKCRMKVLAVVMMQLAAIVSFSLSSCLAAETYKIGGLFAVTGPNSFLGDPEKKSLQMAIDEINARGGIDGHRLEAVIRDTEGVPDKAVLAANELISSEKVVAIIGPSLTPTTLPLVPLVESNKIPLISCAAGIEITEPVKPWVFKTAQSDVLAVATIYEHMKKQNIKKVGILTVENSFGESGKRQLTSQAPQSGIEVVQAESFGGKDTDMTAQLTKIRAAQPDAIICWGTNPGPAVVARNAQQLNIKIPLYQSHGVASPKFIELAQDAAEGILLPTGKILVADQLPDSDPQKPVIKSYIQQFEGQFKMPVSGFGGYAYDAMQLLAKALEGSGGDREKIRAALEKINGHVGVTGTFNFSPTDHNGLGKDAFVMVQIKDGKWKLLAP
ncbi:MAG: ABC transporter substrate-binding protein [Syntrophobacteraceae bacterium]|nr:ABC transporter substrate-binding protein [Syntrophobacteraceae bacterium]